MRSASPHFPRSSPRGGFALLITITLLAFLVLLLVSLATLTRVETSVADNQHMLAQSRQNALLALNLALGQLQRFSGPDQRVSATADLVAPAAAAGTRHWTGVWGNAKASSEMTSEPRFLNWLVSGNEAVTVAAATTTAEAGRITSAAAIPDFRPDVNVPALTGVTALSDLQSGAQHWRLLVGARSVGGSGIAGGDGVAVPAQDIAVQASSLPGFASSDTSQKPIGRYAWWVGDEGVKARVNLVETEDRLASTDDATRRLRYRVAGRTGVEAMTGAVPALALAADAAAGATLREDLRKVLAGRQLGLAAGGTAFPEAFLQARFHDLTPVSQSVFADTLAGGVRKDLTAAFAPGTTATTTPAGPLWTVGPATGPQWQVLRSYYQLADLPRDGDGAVVPQGHTDAGRHGLGPVVALWQWYVEARLVPQAAPNTYQLELRHYPALILWNPYNVPLRDQSYYGTYGFGAPNSSAAVFFTRVTAVSGGAAVEAAAHVGSPYFHFVNGAVRAGNQGLFQFTVQSGLLPPGHAYVYTLPDEVMLPSAAADANAEIEADAGQLVQLTRGWHNTGLNAVVARSPASFTLSPTGTYYASLWAGGGGTTDATKNMPQWNVAMPNPADANVSGHDSLILRVGGPGGDVLQTVQRNNSNLATSSAAATLLNRTPLSSGAFAYYGQKWALKVTDGGALPSMSADTNRRIGWLAHYNPRAPLSSRSPYDYQTPGGTGYFNTNPSYNRATVKSGGSGLPPEFAVNFSGSSAEARAYVAMSQNSWDPAAAEPQAVLFDVPRPDARPLSLGALQHANPYRLNGDGWAANYAPAYPIGNALADPRVGLGSVSEPWPSTTSAGNGATYDHSYLLNRALWDGYYFSSVPAGPAAPSDPVAFPLENSRYVACLRDGAAPAPGDLRSYEKAAANLLVAGAFNVNSTSPEAWRALLAGFNRAPVGAAAGQDGRSPYPRSAYPVEDTVVLDAASGASGLDAAYRGHRFLTTPQIISLADEIVRQVRARGPFVSLADFVNRALTDNPSTGGVDERLRGALAQALEDAGVNSAFSDGPKAELPSVGGSGFTAIPSPTVHTGLTAENVPGWVSQADLLQSLGPALSARSDTFLIRAYGEAVNPLLVATDAGYVQGRAWCEAVVQRMPDYVNPAHAPETDLRTQAASAAKTENQTFGRRFQIVSFRWLGPDEI